WSWVWWKAWRGTGPRSKSLPGRPDLKRARRPKVAVFGDRSLQALSCDREDRFLCGVVARALLDLPQALLEQRGALRKDLQLIGVARGRDREVQQQRQDEPEGHEEQRVGRI